MVSLVHDLIFAIPQHVSFVVFHSWEKHLPNWWRQRHKIEDLSSLLGTSTVYKFKLIIQLQLIFLFKSSLFFFFFNFLKFLFKYSCLHFPSHPHFPPLILKSPFGFVHVSFIDFPENPSPLSPPTSPLVTVSSLFPCFRLCLACLFVLLIRHGW